MPERDLGCRELVGSARKKKKKATSQYPVYDTRSEDKIDEDVYKRRCNTLSDARYRVSAVVRQDAAVVRSELS